jgi:hypothetical protein
MNYFMNGVMEVVSYPIAILLVVALGLFIGQQPKRVLSLITPLFFLTVILGLALVHFKYLTGNFSMVALVMAGLMALSTVLYLKPPLVISGLVSGLSGLVLGLTIKPFWLPGFAGLKVYSTYAGVTLSSTALMVAVGLLTLFLKRFWEGVLVRAISSWIVASVLMVVVLSLTKVLKL